MVSWGLLWSLSWGLWWRPSCGFWGSVARGLLWCNGNHVKSAGNASEPWSAGQVKTRSPDELVLFAPCYRSGAVTKAAVATIPNFHKDQRWAVAHDQVELSEPAAKIGLQALQSLAFQIGARGRFGLMTLGGAIARRAQSETILGDALSLPSRITPQVTSRPIRPSCRDRIPVLPSS